MKFLSIVIIYILLLSCDSNDEPFKDDLIGIWEVVDDCYTDCNGWDILSIYRVIF